MATKKNEEPMIQEEVNEAEEVVEAPVKKSAWDTMVDVRVPRRRPGEEEYHYVCANNKAFLIRLDGKTRPLPLPIAEAFNNWLDDEVKIEEYIESIPSEGSLNGIVVI